MAAPRVARKISPDGGSKRHRVCHDHVNTAPRNGGNRQLQHPSHRYHSSRAFLIVTIPLEL